MTCDLCGGAGWRPVDDGYGLRMVPELTLEEAAHLDGPATAAVERERDRLRISYQQSSFPCSRCNPTVYDRWIDGHLEPEHRSEGCSVCTAVDEVTGKRRRTRRSGQPVPAVTSEPREPDTYQTHADF